MSTAEASSRCNALTHHQEGLQLVPLAADAHQDTVAQQRKIQGAVAVNQKPTEAAGARATEESNGGLLRGALSGDGNLFESTWMTRAESIWSRWQSCTMA
jgi:hypothetical protein